MNPEPTANDARAKFRILLTTSLVSSLIVLDTNIVAVSLPAIGQSADPLDADSAAVAGYVPGSGARSDNGSRGFPVPGRKPHRWKRRHTFSSGSAHRGCGAPLPRPEFDAWRGTKHRCAVRRFRRAAVAVRCSTAFVWDDLALECGGVRAVAASA